MPGAMKKLTAVAALVCLMGCVGPPTRPDKLYRAECREMEDAYNSANGLIIGGTVGGTVILPLSVGPALVTSKNSTSDDITLRRLAMFGLGGAALIGLPLLIAGHAVAPDDDDWVALGCGEPERLPGQRY